MRENRLALAGVVLPLLAIATALEAQYPPCTSRGGTPVVTIASDSLPYAAWAQLTDSGQSVIFWNASRMITASPTVRLLVHLHECAHHVLGHVQKLVPNDVKLEFERQADCWAVQYMVERELVSSAALHAALEEVHSWTGDRTHAGGAALAASMARCLAEKTSVPSWRRFLEVLVFASRDSLASIRGELIPESGDEQVREAIVDAPGVFDCDIRGGHVLVCPLFQGVQGAPVRKRYQEVKAIVLDWIDSSWESVEQVQEGFEQPRLFLAWNREDGTNLSLVVTESHRLFLTWSAIEP